MRGNHHPHYHRTIPLGSIPAYAGEPTARRHSAGQAGVYPRVCGGTRGRAVYRPAAPGLSPRMRGNRVYRPGLSGSARSIPAYAGEPHLLVWHKTFSTVYPRVCGGTAFDTAANQRYWGLSPRMRGNRVYTQTSWHCRRSIPAYAGEPGPTAENPAAREVYPRVCGGTWSFGLGIDQSMGLSPRMRGNLPAVTCTGGSPRSIPAYAGEPCLSVGNALVGEVYPRVCGGTVAAADGYDLVCGLSPRMRGNRGQATVISRVVWSIPAYAGEPKKRGCCSLVSAVYPRVCGGTFLRVAAARFCPGLSPRMRGNHYSGAKPKTQHRSIPAYAGEPARGSDGVAGIGVYPRVCGGTDLPPYRG